MSLDFLIVYDKLFGKADFPADSKILTNFGVGKRIMSARVSSDLSSDE